MSELFSELKNKNFQALTHLINELAVSSELKLTRSEILRYMQTEGLFDEDGIQALLNEKSRPEDNYFILIKNTDNSYSLTINQAIQSKPLSVELIWLKLILHDPKILLFLSESTRIKLRAQLQAYPDLFKNEAVVIRPQEKDDTEIEGPILKKRLILIMRAITERVSLKYDYVDNRKNLLTGKRSMPWRIEYDLKRRTFYILMYSLEEHRPIKSFLQRMSNIELVTSSEKISEPAMWDSLQGRLAPTPLVLKIKDIHNALERTFYSFSYYRKEASYDPEYGAHELKVYYYEFEVNEILSKILSLGRSVTVLEPASIRQEIIHRASKALGHYRNFA